MNPFVYIPWNHRSWDFAISNSAVGHMKADQHISVLEKMVDFISTTGFILSCMDYPIKMHTKWFSYYIFSTNGSIFLSN